MIVFGAACFNFGVYLNKTGDVDAGKYVSLIEKALYESDHVLRGSIVFEYDDTFEFKVNKDESLELLKNGGGFPLPMFFKLQFDISIPKHVQDEINKKFHFDIEIDKPVRVKIVETFYGPVAFVLLDSDSIDDASSAVILIREYLKKHLLNKSVYLESIGPSPFHADFSLSTAEGEKQIEELDVNGFSVKTLPRKGYDHICFKYSSSKFANEQEAIDELLDHISGEFSFFYLVSKFRVKKIHAWEEIDSLYNQLVETSINANWWARTKLVLSPHGKLTQQLLNKLTSFEMMAVSQAEALNESYDSEYSKGLPTYLQDVIDKEWKRRSESYPTKQISYFLEFHEKRFMQIWQTALLAISALVGALIGAVITALAGK